MITVWESTHTSVTAVCQYDSLRVTNLVIAAATRHATSTKKRKAAWGAKVARDAVLELALSPLETMSDDARLWQRIAERAYEAAHLGMTPEGMHSWAAAYQRATTTQKALGAYATHNAFASSLARITIDPLLQRGPIKRIVDPSVGAGNLLLAAVELYGRNGTDAELKRFILSLHGAELDPRARELCCLLLWLSGARSGVTLSQIAGNIRLANALTLDWWSNQEPFDVLLMNPPWESLRHKVDDDLGGERAATLARLTMLKDGAPGLPTLYSGQGTGDRNLFKAFVELAPHLLVNGGRLGALLPSAFASDAGMTELRERYLNQFEIAKWTGYENRAGYFPIDKRYKFGLLAATRSNVGTQKFLVRGFAVEPDEVDAPHIALQRKDIALIGRKYHIIPELSHQRELEILRVALSKGIPLFESGPLGKVNYRREVDLSLSKANFHHVSSKDLIRCGDATFLDEKATHFVPLLEGRSVGAYDCFQKTWESGKGRTAVWVENFEQPLSSCSPQYIIAPLSNQPPRIALCDVTASTNTRTVIATWVPRTWRCGNTAPVLEFESDLLAFAGLGILNSMVFDWVARRLVSGLHLNKFILEGLVWPRLDEGSIEEVAYAAWSICISKPRSGLNHDELKSPPWVMEPSESKRMALRPVDAAAVIEAIVARGLGISHEQLMEIYDNDRSDRRGFWRYFDVEPSSVEVANTALGFLSKNNQ